MACTKYLSFISIVLTLTMKCVICEFITMALVGTALAAGAGSWWKWDAVTDNTYCRFTECCNSDYVPYDLNKLKLSLTQKLFGQPLVYEVLNILTAHKEAVHDESKGNDKALVISLHGWSGVGKNYAAKIIAEAIYKKGMKSKYVKLFMGDTDFDCTDVEKSKKELMSNVKKIVSSCKKSLIIFDEVHLMCPGILDAIKPMLDHHHAVDDVDYRDAIFIFISNIGGANISSTLIDYYNDGLKRSDVEFRDFEPIIRRAAYHTGGFKTAALIAQHLIDHYIPFLPLEQHHVEMCARAEFAAYGVYHPTNEMMLDALSVITYGPTEDQPIFANNGCKRFTRHIPYVLQKHLKKDEL